MTLRPARSCPSAGSVASPSGRWAPRGPSLVGRERELEVLEAEFALAAQGEFRVVLLLGDPGVGKTRLAGEVLARHGAGGLGLAARAHPLGGTTSFGLWAEAFEGHLRGVDPSEVSRLCGGFVDDLGGLLRSAAAVRGAAPAAEPPRARLLEGLAVLLDNLARAGPAVVFLDDMHVADASSWDALHYLARNLVLAPVLVLAAARPVELTHEQGANQILLGLEQDGLLTRLRLSPLSSDAVGELTGEVLGRPPPPALVSWLEQRSRGNPLFVLGLLRALLEEGADLAAPRLARLPEGLAERVTTRLGQLDEPVRSALEVLAVVGRRVELSAVAALTGRPLDRVGPVLDDLVRARLVTEEGRGREVTYEIAHPLFQEAIYQDLGGARRRALHRLVGRALLAAGRLGEAAPHFSRSADAGDPEAIEALCGAVRQAEERHLFREALTLLGTLVELVPPDDSRWLEVVDGMVLQADWVLDHRADVHAALAIPALRAIDSALEGSDDISRQALVKFRLASFLAWGLGEIEEAERVCNASLELYEKAGDRTGTWLATLELGYVKGFAGDIKDGWVSTGRRVAEAAEAAGDRFVLMQALGRAVGWGCLFLGAFEESEAALRRGVELARESSRTYFQALSLFALGYSLAFEGRISEAHRFLDQAKAVDPNWRESLQLEWEITIHWLAGAFDAALTQAQESVSWNSSGMSRRRAVGHAFAVLAAVDMDRLPEARRYLAMQLGAYGDRPVSGGSEVCRHAGAVLRWHEGDRAAALADLQHVAFRLVDMGFRPYAAFALLDLAELAAQGRDAETATAAADALADIAGQVDRDLYRALAALGSAWAGLAGGSSSAAATAAGEAVTLLQGLGYPAFSGRALDALGRALAPVERTRARDAFTAAADTFDACGASRRRDRVLAALRRMGGVGARGRAATGHGPAALTHREREVARLAAQGHPALAIARELFIGERTVESHLARIYAKLGITSKLELVQRADELDLEPSDPGGP